MDINTKQLNQIREYRAKTDPLIPHPPTQAWLSHVPETIEDWVYEARKERITTAPTDEPIQKATWPEVTVLCFTQSMDGAIKKEQLLGVYQYALDKTLSKFNGNSFQDLVPSTTPIVINDEHRKLGETYRALICKKQHEDFVATRYDNPESPSVNIPKAFWKKYSHSLLDSDSEEDEEEDEQFSLTDFE